MRAVADAAGGGGSGAESRRVGADAAGDAGGTPAEGALADSTSVVLMAEARMQQGRVGEAAALAAGSLAIVPTSARAYACLGNALYHMERRSEEAVAACSAAVALHPNDKHSKFRLGCLLRRVPGRLAEAVHQLQGCIHIEQTYPGGVEALDEAVDALRELRKPRRGWKPFAFNLAGALTFIVMFVFFMGRD